MIDPTPDLVRVVSAAILDPSGRILLCRRHPDPNVPGFSEKWCCPGGKVEPGESDIEALRRELLEEVSLEDVEVDRMVAYYILRTDGYPRAYSVTTYLVRIADPAKAVLTHAGGQDMRWVEPGILFMEPVMSTGDSLLFTPGDLLRGTEVVLRGLRAIGLLARVLWVPCPIRPTSLTGAPLPELTRTDFLQEIRIKVSNHLRKWGHTRHIQAAVRLMPVPNPLPDRSTWIEQHILPDGDLTPDNLGVDRIIFYTSETP